MMTFNKALELYLKKIFLLVATERTNGIHGLIHYAAEIDLSQAQQEACQKEWSFMFDTMLKVFGGGRLVGITLAIHCSVLVYSLA